MKPKEDNLFEPQRRPLAKPAAPTPDPEPAASDGGIECPKCGCRDLRVIYTRPRERRLERRRECRHCGRRITTYEQRVLG